MSEIITNRSRLLEQSNSKLVNQYNMIDKYIIIFESTREGIILQASAAFCRVSGYSMGELIGSHHRMMSSTGDPDEAPVDLCSLIRDGENWEGELRSKTKEGTDFWLAVHVQPKLDDRNGLTGILIVGEDITDKKQLKKLSVTDPLTALYNRNKLNEVLPTLVYSAQRYNQSLSLIMIDIDRFKEVNDTFGHQTGDMVLKEFAGIFKKNIRQSDTAGRWGGEEFIITCPDTDRKSTVKLAEKLRRLCEKQHFPGIPPQTASFGVTEFRKTDSLHDLISRADSALYLAKGDGRNRVRWI